MVYMEAMYFERIVFEQLFIFEQYFERTTPVSAGTGKNPTPTALCKPLGLFSAVLGKQKYGGGVPRTISGPLGST